MPGHPPAFDDVRSNEEDPRSQARPEMNGRPGAGAIGRAGNWTSDAREAVVELRTHARTNVAICLSVPLPDYDREARPSIAVDVDKSLVLAVGPLFHLFVDPQTSKATPVPAKNPIHTVVCTENLNPNVVMVKSAKHGV